MKSILSRVQSETIEKKSLFINYMIPVRTVEQAKDEFQLIKQEHPDANHHCYAYVIGEHQEHQKYFDDGEPNRTAGLPMMDVLLKNDVTDVLTVTVRYFGGIKLGAGGLVRMYAKSVSESMKLVHFSILTTYDVVEVIIDFDLIGNVEHLLRSDYDLVNTTYDNRVHYFVEVKKENTKQFKKWIQEQTSGKNEVRIVDTLTRYE